MSILAEQQIDIWLESLVAPDHLVKEFYGLLSGTEQQRCDRFVLPLVRSRSIVARGRLRVLLGQYMNLHPAKVPLTVGSQGKPQVRGLEFNLSHSGDLVAYAFGLVPLGIDIEQRRSMDYGQLVERFFAEDEWQEWQQLPETAHAATFFQVWTVKEAYLKAIGTGLYRSLSTVPVQLKPPWLLRQNGGAWQVAVLAMPEGYLGAAVVAGQGHELRVNRCGID
jgi:4'-phosphopantetheinyl transferase